MEISAIGGVNQTNQSAEQLVAAPGNAPMDAPTDMASSADAKVEESNAARFQLVLNEVANLGKPQANHFPENISKALDQIPGGLSVVRNALVDIHSSEMRDKWLNVSNQLKPTQVFDSEKMSLQEHSNSLLERHAMLSQVQSEVQWDMHNRTTYFNFALAEHKAVGHVINAFIGATKNILNG